MTKRYNKIVIEFFIIALLIMIPYSILVYFIFNTDISAFVRMTSITLITVMLLPIFIITFLAIIYVRKKRETIIQSFDSYVETMISQTGVGVLIFNDEFEIVWASNFIENRIGRTIIGSNLYSLSNKFSLKIENGIEEFKFTENNITFLARINFDEKLIVLKDITNEELVLKQYSDEKAVIAELEIDNFQQLQVVLSQEELFKIQSSVIKMLDFLVDKYKIIYRQYLNGKFIIFTNQQVLNEFVKNNFNFLDQIRKTKINESNLMFSVSIGVGHGLPYHSDLIELAKEGLLQALSRGGDQVAVMEGSLKAKYYGSKTEHGSTTSRVKIKQISSNIEEKLDSNKIKNVLIFGHQDADLDAIGASLGIYQISKLFNKNVYIQNITIDNTTEEFLNESFSSEFIKNTFIKPSKSNKIATKKDTLVFIVDTAEANRIENPKILEKVNLDNVFILDHHRVSKFPDEIPMSNIYIDTTASSSSEIVSEIIQFFKTKIKLPKDISQMLLNGIYLDTKQFTFATSTRTFAAASWLEEFGASSSVSSKILKLPEKYATTLQEILSLTKEVKPGFFLSSYSKEVPQDIISLAADEILRTRGRKAAFVIAKLPGSTTFKLSARGIDTNVQIIAESVGGGGHFTASAATSKEPIDIFTDNVINAIITADQKDRN